MNPDWELPFPQVGSGGLPIFRQDHAQYALFYAPGYVGVVAKEHSDEFENQIGASSPPANPGAANLRNYAAQALQTWQSLYSRPFTPLCLTLYLNNRCNLACTYCYSSAVPSSSETLGLDAIRSVAEIVLANCQERSQPFTVVFHGGGEPSLEQSLADAALSMLAQMGKERGVPLFRYIATNGVMSAQRAMWLAANFDLIGLSCDGPEDIQTSQRSLAAHGKNSTAAVERTAMIVHEAGTPLNVRVTLTAATLARQPEIAEYICQKLKPLEIHVEVAYQGGRMQDSFAPDQIEKFIVPFLEAREAARRYGVTWVSSGSRPAEIHGPYCNVLRDVINLAPGNLATACLKLSRAGQIRQAGLSIGESDPSGQFNLDLTQIEKIRQSLLNKLLPGCAACFNRFHCVRSCPDTCLLDEPLNVSDFRCAEQRLMTMITLQEIARRLWSSTGAAGRAQGSAFLPVSKIIHYL